MSESQSTSHDDGNEKQQKLSRRSKRLKKRWSRHDPMTKQERRALWVVGLPVALAVLAVPVLAVLRATGVCSCGG